MPDDFLDEINRWDDTDPGTSEKEYVQWQRGPKSATPLNEMQSWIDKIVTRDNIWLVLVFHGVEGIGWEPKTAAELKAYFEYIAEREDVWVAPFRDATRYMRERMAAVVTSVADGDEIRVELTHGLDPALYNYPLTLRTRVPAGWEIAEVTQGSSRIVVPVVQHQGGAYVSYDALPHDGSVVLRRP
jgi:hypothetical protein